MVSESQNKQTLLKRLIEGIQGLMIAYVTNERTNTQPAEYQELYYQLHAALDDAGYANPNSHRSLDAFWRYCKLMEMTTYESRRIYVRELYADVLFDIERVLRRAEDPRHWKTVNEQLTDAFGPIRRQWLKAKNYAYSTPPDFENSIKESTNAIESTLKVLTGNAHSTLGELVKQVDIDQDVRRILSHMYGLVSNKAFVRHGAMQTEDIGQEEAEFFLEFAAISIIYLKNKLESEQ